MQIAFLGSHELGQITLKALIDTNNNIAAVVTPVINDDWYKGVGESCGRK